jgi:molybdopterin biosynthesis enzyme
MHSTSTRFWLGLVPEQAAQLVHQVLVAEVGESNIRVRQTTNAISIQVVKPAGEKTIEGSFVIRSNSSIQAEGHTLVVMYRSKVRICYLLS